MQQSALGKKNKAYSRIVLWRSAYASFLLWGIGILLGSLVLQLFWPAARGDSPQPQKHAAFCTGQLASLKKELEEACLQDLSQLLHAAEGSLAERQRRAAWRGRLDEALLRCADQPTQLRLGRVLQDLERRSNVWLDEGHLLWQKEGRALDQAIEALRD